MDVARLLSQTEHRPYPLPRGPWLMTQVWHDLLFAHWAVEPQRLRPFVPEPFDLDTVEASGYVFHRSESSVAEPASFRRASNGSGWLSEPVNEAAALETGWRL